MMNMKEVLAVMAANKKANAQKWNNEGAGSMIKGINDKEGAYTVGCKTTRSRNNGIYKPTFVNRIKI